MKEDLKLIDKFINHKLNEEEIQLVNERLSNEEDFRQLYLNHILDDRLISKALQAEIDSVSIPNEEQVAPKRKSILFPTLIAAAAALAITFFLLPKQESAGEVAQFGNDAKILRNGKEIKIEKNFKLKLGDKIISDKEKLSFRYQDGTEVILNPESELEITGDNSHKKIFLESGELSADVKPQQKDKKMEISTSTSKAFILGTKFVIKAEESKSNLKVLKGKVHFHNKTGSEDYVVGGEYALARKDAPVISRLSHIPEEKIESDLKKYMRWKAFSNKFIESPDMVAYYDFEDVNDSKNNILRNKATVTKDLNMDGEIITTMPMDGRWVQKGALYFSEYGYVNFKNSDSYNISGSITVFAWMRVKKFYRGWQTIISKGDHTWRLARNRQHNYLEFCCNGIKPNHVLIGKKNVNDGQWHLIVGTYNKEEICLYVDGELDHKMKAKGKVNTDNYPVMIGANSRHANRDFEGWIDELGIMKRALTHEEIKEMYDIGKP